MSLLIYVQHMQVRMYTACTSTGAMARLGSFMLSMCPQRPLTTNFTLPKILMRPWTDTIGMQLVLIEVVANQQAKLV